MNYFKNKETILIISEIVSKKLIKVSFFEENVPIEVMYISGIIKIESIELKPKNSTEDKSIAIMLKIVIVNICFLANIVLWLLNVKTNLYAKIEIRVSRINFIYSMS
jgi:hypothetical protein